MFLVSNLINLCFCNLYHTNYVHNFVGLISKSFFFEEIVNSMCFIFISTGLLSVYRNLVDFLCVSLVSLDQIPYFLVLGRFFCLFVFGRLSGVSCFDNHAIYKWRKFYFFLSNLHVLFCTCLTTVARTSCPLNKSGGNRYPCFAPNLREEIFDISPLRMM